MVNISLLRNIALISVGLLLFIYGVRELRRDFVLFKAKKEFKVFLFLFCASFSGAAIVVGIIFILLGIF